MARKGFAQRYLDAWNAHDTDQILSFFSRRATYVDSGLHQQVEGVGVGHHIDKLLALCPDVSFQLLDGSLSANGRMVIRWQATGKKISRLCPNALPTGCGPLNGLDYIVHDQGKLISTHVYFDLTSLIPPPDPQSSSGTPSDPARQYLKSGLSEQDLLQYRQQLSELMEREKLYLNNELTLDELADNLGISANHLSQVINSQFGLNFYELLNHFRIEQAKKLLGTLSPDDRLSSLDVAFESGFGSASAFYRAFQQHVRMTPTRFLKQLRSRS